MFSQIYICLSTGVVCILACITGQMTHPLGYPAPLDTTLFQIPTPQTPPDTPGHPHRYSWTHTPTHPFLRRPLKPAALILLEFILV